MKTSGRVAICVGCNAYEDELAADLRTAELDARRMFDALTSATYGGYHKSASKLLLSPTLQDVRNAISNALFDAKNPADTFTFFFAGHGKVSGGSFYMWLRDTKYSAQSITALSLSDLFRALNEVGPSQSNIIIDACESGGLIKDLGTVLNQQGLGDSASSGITLFASAAQDQMSGEAEAGGFGTIALLDCIEGRDFVQDRTATLDLVEIGRRVSERFEGSQQTPVVWGLNLLQAPRFCRNPRHKTDPAKPFREAIATWPAGKLDRRAYESLWAAYASLSADWKPRTFLNQIRPVLWDDHIPPSLRADLAVRLAASMSERAKESRDAFRTVQAAACISICLLRDLHQPGVSEGALAVERFAEQHLTAAAEKLVQALRADEYVLLQSRTGTPLAELYFLPLRVADILGWLGLWAAAHPGTRGSLFREVLAVLTTRYGGSICALSDRQAPGYAVGISAAVRLGLANEAEELASRLFRSLVDYEGKVAPVELRAKDALEFLARRQARAYEPGGDLVQSPTQLGAVLFRAAAGLGLGKTFDDSLWKLDGLGLYSFIPGTYLDYGADSIREGGNMVWTIGHDLFRTNDLEQSWPPAAPNSSSQLEATLATLASLVLPDRVPWFWFPPVQSHAPRSPSAS